MSIGSAKAVPVSKRWRCSAVCLHSPFSAPASSAASLLPRGHIHRNVDDVVSSSSVGSQAELALFGVNLPWSRPTLAYGPSPWRSFHRTATISELDCFFGGRSSACLPTVIDPLPAASERRPLSERYTLSQTCNQFYH